MTRYLVTEVLADGTTQTACGPFAVGAVFTVDFPPQAGTGHQPLTGLTTHDPPVGLPTEYAWYPLNEAHIAQWLERGAIRYVDDGDGDTQVLGTPAETPAQIRMRHAREAKAAKAAGDETAARRFNAALANTREGAA